MNTPVDHANTRAQNTAVPSDWANFLWVAILCVAGVGGSLVISCVAPFVALAVALAGTVRLSLALRAMSVIWFTNQLIGFCFFHFPRTANTFLWGFTIGGAALLSTWVASLAINRARPSSIITRLTLALGVGFFSYEGTLVVAALVLGGVETFAPATVAQLALVNAVWFGGLIALNELISILGKSLIGEMPRLVKA